MLKENGLIVSPVSQPDERHRTTAGRPGRRYLAQANRADLERIASLLETGEVRPAIASRLGLDHAHQALAQLERGGTRGKSILTC